MLISEFHFLPFFLFLLFALPVFASQPTIHFPIRRRGGDFPSTGLANFTFLHEELAKVEARYSLTRREVNGNKLVRKAKSKAKGGGEDGGLMAEVGREGAWYV